MGPEEIEMSSEEAEAMYASEARAEDWAAHAERDAEAAAFYDDPRGN